MPGMEIPLHFQADKIGIYEVPCSELCGLGHFQMRTTMQVMSEADFEKWKQRRRPKSNDPQDPVPTEPQFFRGELMSSPVAHAHHAPQGFIRKYVFSLDHKVIGIQYYFLGLFSVFVGMSLSLLMRYHMVNPERQGGTGSGSSGPRRRRAAS